MQHSRHQLTVAVCAWLNRERFGTLTTTTKETGTENPDVRRTVRADFVCFVLNLVIAVASFAALVAVRMPDSGMPVNQWRGALRAPAIDAFRILDLSAAPCVVVVEQNLVRRTL
jgi:hypothetical protein